MSEAIPTPASLPDGTPGTIRVRRIEVVDDHGTPRVIIGCVDHPAEKYPDVEKRRESYYGLRTFQSDGSWAHYIAASDDASDIVLWANGDPEFQLTTYEDGREPRMHIGNVVGEVDVSALPRLDRDGVPIGTSKADDQPLPLVTGSCQGCDFSHEPWHDMFLGLETSAAPWLYFVDHSEDIEGPQDFDDISAFIRCHNWQDPNAMELVSQRLSHFTRDVTR